MEVTPSNNVYKCDYLFIEFTSKSLCRQQTLNKLRVHDGRKIHRCLCRIRIQISILSVRNKDTSCRSKHKFQCIIDIQCVCVYAALS